MKRFSFQPRYCQGRDSWIIDLFHDPESWAEHLATLQAMLLCVTLSSNKLWKSWQLGVNSSSLVAWNSRSFSGDVLILLIPEFPGIEVVNLWYEIPGVFQEIFLFFWYQEFPGIEVVTLWHEIPGVFQEIFLFFRFQELKWSPWCRFWWFRTSQSRIIIADTCS